MSIQGLTETFAFLENFLLPWQYPWPETHSRSHICGVVGQSSPSFHPSPPTPEAQAAVALVRVLRPEPSLLVIRRAANPRDPWSGHFSLPGGRRESEDDDLLATCMRETREEVGMTLTRERLIRPLPVAFAGSGLGQSTPVQPFLFEIEEKPDLTLMEAEVASAHWVAESFIQKPSSHVLMPMLSQWPNRIFPGIPLADYFIWGFTYGIMRDYFGGFPAGD